MSIYAITQDIIDQLLHSNPDMQIHPIQTINAGFSGSKVLLVQITGSQSPYIGIAFAKIDTEARCWEEYRNHKHALEAWQTHEMSRYIPDFITEPSEPIDGYSMVLYQSAHDSPHTIFSLAKMMDDGYNAATITGQLNKLLNQVFAVWHSPDNLTRNGQLRTIPEMFRDLINVGDPDHFDELENRIRLYDLPSSRYTLLTFRPGTNIEYSNPFAYIMRPELWDNVNPVVMPYAPLHGDLHGGNIICQTENSESPPWLIDFASYRTQGIPFFDLAYLELDLLIRYLGLSGTSTESQWQDWVNLTQYINNEDILPAESDTHLRLHAERMWEIVRPIRKHVHNMIGQAATYKTDFEKSWWLAATVVGVLFARRSRIKNRETRIANILYAATALQRLNDLTRNQLEKSAIEIKWKEDPWEGPPYPGLGAFTADETSIFFGRNPQIEELCELIRNNRAVVVTGPSGSGKSSLLGAGVLPVLQKGIRIKGSDEWIIVRFRPNSATSGNPFASLAIALLNHPEAETVFKRDPSLATNLRRQPGLLREMWEGHTARIENGLRQELVLYIDQFEEIFTTLIEEHLLEPFIQLLNITSRSNRIRIIATLRSDFLPQCFKYPEINDVIRHDFKLLPPDPLALVEMVQRPAERAGLELEDELVRLLVTEADARQNPGGLALMAYTLRQIYDQEGHKGKLTAKTYHQIGGVHGAIAQKADETLSDLWLKNPEETFTRVFYQLIGINEDTRLASRQRARLSQFQDDEASKLIRGFLEARLFVSDQDSQGQPVVEISHEALLHSWPRLVTWVKQTEDDIRLLKKLRRDAQDWDKHGRLYTLSHEQIAPFLKMIEKLKPDLTPVERDYLQPEQEKRLLELNNHTISANRRKDIGERLADIGDMRAGVGVRQDAIPDISWCQVEAGTVTLADSGDTIDVPAFLIAKYPITYRQYRAFPDAHDKQHQHSNNAPADNISWHDAIAYIDWLNIQLAGEHIGRYVIGENCVIRLPKEWEWQLAAGEQTRFPWGDALQLQHANTVESSLRRSTAVGMYPDGAAACGALDMIGNVWEWCLNEYSPPYAVNPDSTECVLRGGSYAVDSTQANNHFRNWLFANFNQEDFGFRVVCAGY